MARGRAKKSIEQTVDVNTDRLYGDLDDAIAYLREVRDAHMGIDIRLGEHWFGYEDMCLQFSYQREETQVEYETRLEIERIERESAAERKRQADQRARDEKEFRRLSLKLYGR